MAWRIVRQPNGKFARFSDVVDHFTHWNMNEEQAVALCLDLMGDEYGLADATRKVDAAINDFIPFTRTKGTGISRWDDCLETIEFRHGKDELAQIIALGNAT